MAKKNRGPQFIPSALNTPMINYNEYYMNTQEKILTFLLGFIGGGLVGLVFYCNQFLDEDGYPTLASAIGNVVIFVGIGLLACKFVFPMRREQLRVKRIKTLRKQFRSFLETIAVSLSSGMNISDALLSAYNDLKVEFSENAYIVIEVKEMIDGIQNNIIKLIISKRFVPQRIYFLDSFQIIKHDAVASRQILFPGKSRFIRSTSHSAGEFLEELSSLALFTEKATLFFRSVNSIYTAA